MKAMTPSAYLLNSETGRIVLHPLRSGRWALYVNGELCRVAPDADRAARAVGLHLGRHRWRETRAGGMNPLLWSA